MLKHRSPIWLALLLLFVTHSAAVAVEAQEASLPELVRRVKPSVVSIITYDAKGETLMTGSGFFISPGQVLTNLHVIEGARRAEIRTLDGKGKTYPVLGMIDVDEEGDLALLSINLPETTRPRILEVTNALPEEGEKIFVIGNPLRLEGSVTDGIVSAVREVPNLGKIIQVTAPISNGNSGSPLFNMKGQVLGVITIKVTNGQNINLALGSSRIAALKPAARLLSFDDLAARNKNGMASDVQAEWWYRNGLSSLWLGNYDNALGYFEGTVNKNPNRADAWIQVGYCKVKQGKNNDAIKAYQKAIQIRPSPEAFNKLGDAYYYAARFNEAIEAYKEAARRAPRLAEAYYNLGMTYLELSDRDAAVIQSHILQSLDKEMYNKLMSEMQK
jgi:tetratricopeptide (TPR) repeat protein